jgi:hypothetical protein
MLEEKNGGQCCMVGLVGFKTTAARDVVALGTKT